MQNKEVVGVSMKSRGMVIAAVCLITALLLCGCNEKPAGEQNTLSDKIIFMPSDIFQLINGSLDFTTNKSGGIVAVKVTMMFQNIADRMVSANVTVTFYDKNDTQLYVTHRQFYDYPPGYRDQSVLPANTVIYDGENVSMVDHVVISVEEIKGL